MLHKLSNWFHKLLNPHCEECLRITQCEHCNDLRSLLEMERSDKTKILTALLNFNKPIVSESNEIIEKTEPYIPKITNWRVRREMLENEDRQSAALLYNRMNELRKNQSVDDIEKELEVSNIETDNEINEVREKEVKKNAS